jgi:hypothetical protein
MSTETHSKEADSLQALALLKLRHPTWRVNNRWSHSFRSLWFVRLRVVQGELPASPFLQG